MVSALALMAGLGVSPGIAAILEFDGGVGGLGGSTPGNDGGHGLNGDGTTGWTAGGIATSPNGDGGDGGKYLGEYGNHGSDATNTGGTGGGGGGGASAGGPSVPVLTGSYTGGTGGRGGNGDGAGNGGGGGGGGAGYAVVDGSTITYNYGPYSITGGNGGRGGDGGTAGAGGNGGTGVLFSTFDTGPVSGAPVINTLNNVGNTITGGVGGDGLNGDVIGSFLNSGVGGFGVVILGNGNVTNSGWIAGGAGGTGLGAGSNGGFGGYGIVIIGAGTVTNSGWIAGGKGGDAGTGGSGGTGGIGVYIAGGTVTNFGIIAGGAGGAGATAGLGGAGVVGGGLTVTQAGARAAISGGLSGDGTTRANAIELTGGTNTLIIQNKVDSGITGNINFDATASLTLDTTLAGAHSNVVYGYAITQTGIGTAGSVIVNAGAGNVITLTGQNNYTGNTEVQSGTLQVGDVATVGIAGIGITSFTTVDSGATLRGTGTIAPVSPPGGPLGVPPAADAVAVSGGGTLWPGATGETSGHMLIVNGNVTFADSTATFKSTGFVSRTGLVSNDTLNVSGGLTANGAKINLAGVFLPNTPYQLITTSVGPITPKFATSVVTDQTTLMKYVSADVQYIGDPVVYITPQLSLAGVAQTPNQTGVAGAINAQANGASGNGAALLGGLLTYNAAQGQRAFDALSGEGLIGQQQTAFRAGDLFVTTMMDQAVLWSGGRENVFIGMKDGGLKDGGQEAPKAARLWATGFGQQASENGGSSWGSASLSSNTSGFAAGVDYEATRNFLVGFAGGYSYSNFSVSDRATKGSVEGAHAGLYGIAHAGSFYLAGAGEYAHYGDKTNRTINYTGGALDEYAKASFSSDEWLGRVEAGYKYRAGWTFTPFGGFQAATLGTGAFSESSQLLAGGAGVAGLHVNGQTTDSEKSFVGLQVDTKTVVNGWTVTPYVRASWEHEFNTNRLESAYLLSLPAGGFTVYGAAAAADVARVQSGIKAEVASNVSVFASFDGQFADRGDSYAGTGGVIYRW